MLIDVAIPGWYQ